MFTTNSFCSGLKDTDTLQILKKLKVLVVDDNQDSCDLISFLLEPLGVQVVIATSALKALANIDQLQPHILVSDIVMPDVDGYSLIRRIRHSKLASKDITAVAITALSGEEVLNQTKQAGFDACLVKPFDADEFIDLLVFLHYRKEVKNRHAEILLESA